jgi:hypothetical protein
MRVELCPHLAVEYQDDPMDAVREIRDMNLCALEHVVGCGKKGMLLYGIAKVIAERTWTVRRTNFFPHNREREYQRHQDSVFRLLGVSYPQGWDVLRREPWPT